MNEHTLFFPEEINDFFTDMAGLPHQSGNEYPIYEYVIRQTLRRAEALPEPLIIVSRILDRESWRQASPGERVIVLRRLASAPEMEKTPKVILQGHLDMVYYPGNQEVTAIPFGPTYWDETLKANVLKRGGQNAATGFSLGADNAVGLAAALAIITDKTGKFLPLRHGVIECLFTVQEETNLGGAMSFDIGMLQGDTLLNLDSEDVKVITFGSAGGSSVTYRLRPTLSTTPAGETAAQIQLSGLTGGHSGLNIHQGGANAIKIAAALCRQLREIPSLTPSIAAFNSGDADNAIPNSFTLNISTKANFQELENQCRLFFQARKQLFSRTDPDMTWSIQPIRYSGPQLDPAASQNLIDLLAAIPCGVMKMLPSPAEVVESSANLGVIRFDPALNNGDITIICSNRSASEKNLTMLETLHRDTAALYGLPMYVNTGVLDAMNVLQSDFSMTHEGALIIEGRYPGWMPNENSPLLKTALAVFKNKFPDIPEKELKNVIHAGLECGWFVQRFNGAGRPLDCIAIGPAIHTPHSWNERLETDTVPIFMALLLDILKKLWP